MIRSKKVNKDSKHTVSKGCLESKYLAAKSIIAWSLVRVVRALTRLSRSFFSIRSLDTREESPKPENVHSLERRCCRVWTQRSKKNAIRWVPDSAPPLPPFSSWMQARSGLISSISASVGGESHEANFFTSLETSKGGMPYWSEGETFRSLI
jgi:hypothetical protein